MRRTVSSSTCSRSRCSRCARSWPRRASPRRRCSRWSAAAWSNATASPSSGATVESDDPQARAQRAPNASSTSPAPRRCATTTRSPRARSGTPASRAHAADLGRGGLRRIAGLEGRRPHRLRHRRPALRGADHQPAQRRMGKLPPELLRASPRRARSTAIRRATSPRSACRRRSTRFTADLVERFPNLSVIDVDAVLKQVRAHRRPGLDGGAGGVLVLARGRRAGAAGRDQRQPGRAPARRRRDARARRQPPAAAAGAGLGVRGDRPAVGPGRGDRGVGPVGRGRHARVRPAVGSELDAGRGRRRARHAGGAGGRACSRPAACSMRRRR